VSRFRTTSAAILVTAITLSACSGSDAATTTTTTALITTTAAPTITTAQTTTTTGSIDPTTTTLQDGAVGSREALIEAMQPALEFSESIFDADISTAPIPEINGPDPVEALRELLLLDFWVYSNAPLDSWADVLAVPGSPDWSLYLGAFDSLFFRTATFDEVIPAPYEILEARTATQEELNQFPDGVLTDAGPDAVGVVYRTRMAPHVLRDPEAPEADEARDGWDTRTQVALLLPTDVGWQFYWSEFQ
jgi:hypothetical protein